MSHICNAGPILRVSTPAFALITGSVSGTTPKVSGWIELKDVDTFTVAITQGTGVNGVWTADVATDSVGRDVKPLPSPPTFPSGVAATGSPVIQMPGDMFYFMRLTFTPSAGSSTAVANAGKIVSKPVSTARSKTWGMGIYVPAADTLACDISLEYSSNWDGRSITGSTTATPQFHNTTGDPAIWSPAVGAPSSSGVETAIAIPSVVGSAGQNAYYRFGLFEPVAIRLNVTPTAGFGHVRAWSNGKA